MNLFRSFSMRKINKKLYGITQYIYNLFIGLLCSFILIVLIGIMMFDAWICLSIISNKKTEKENK